MAGRPITLRLRYPSGAKTISLSASSSLSDLVSSATSALSCPASTPLLLKTGYPLQPIPSSDPTATLESLGVRSGETVHVEALSGSGVGETPARPAAVAGMEATPSVVQGFAQTPARGALPPPAPSTPPPRDFFSSMTPSRHLETTSTSAHLVPLTPSRSNPTTKGPVSASIPLSSGNGWLMLRVVPDDNACLFRAAGLVLLPSHSSSSSEEDVSTYLRKIVADAVLADPERWCAPVLGKQPGEYVRQMLRRDTWGGAIELAVLAEHFKTEVTSIDVQTGRADRFGEHENYPQRILLVYSGIHYDALTLSPLDPADLRPLDPDDFPPEIGFDQTIFPTGEGTGEEEVVEAAGRLVARLREQHYYTDTATFTLKCEICGEGLTGEKEARQHAERIGHTSFGEY